MPVSGNQQLYKINFDELRVVSSTVTYVYCVMYL